MSSPSKISWLWKSIAAAALQATLGNQALPRPLRRAHEQQEQNGCTPKIAAQVLVFQHSYEVVTEHQKLVRSDLRAESDRQSTHQEIVFLKLLWDQSTAGPFSELDHDLTAEF